MPNCPHCNSDKVRNAGSLLSGTKRFKCNSCTKWFTNNPRQYKISVPKKGKKFQTEAICQLCKLTKHCVTNGEKNSQGFVYRDETGRKWSKTICPDCIPASRNPHKDEIKFHPTYKCRLCKLPVEITRYFYCRTCIPELETEDPMMEKVECIYWDESEVERCLESECRVCNKTQPRSEFYRDFRAKDGIDRVCRTCHSRKKKGCKQTNNLVV